MLKAKVIFEIYDENDNLINMQQTEKRMIAPTHEQIVGGDMYDVYDIHYRYMAPGSGAIWELNGRRMD